MCNVPSLNISVLAQSKVGTYFRLHLGNRCSGTDGHRISFKNVKENPLPSPFFAICEGAVKAFNAVGDSYAPRGLTLYMTLFEPDHRDRGWSLDILRNAYPHCALDTFNR